MPLKSNLNQMGSIQVIESLYTVDCFLLELKHTWEIKFLLIQFSYWTYKLQLVEICASVKIQTMLPEMSSNQKPQCFQIVKPSSEITSLQKTHLQIHFEGICSAYHLFIRVWPPVYWFWYVLTVVVPNHQTFCPIFISDTFGYKW